MPFTAPITVPVHPHSRGEHCTPCALIRQLDGSSPLARGTPEDQRKGCDPGRFIPTRAGNTSPSGNFFSTTSVHPHSRGEHTDSSTTEQCTAGSSPLARGTPGHEGDHVGRARFIPTRAGNTSSGRRPSSSAPVHPHSRGEHIAILISNLRHTGSSPLARGTQAPTLSMACRQRFIPTRAGNTQGDRIEYRTWAVHPHSRGEHGRPPRRARPIGGSSPLARGTPRSRSPWRRSGRFIPTRAGNTNCTAIYGAGTSVHPHSRGEHKLHRVRRQRRFGSSPLARGTRLWQFPAADCWRFIPTRAGNT